jgi:uncharacterized protein YchJ
VAAELPDFEWLKTYLVPTDAGEFYALLGVLIAFLAFFKSSRPTRGVSPKVTVNNFLAASDPFRHAERNGLCPCGSGQKFKQCHGSAAS